MLDRLLQFRRERVIHGWAVGKMCISMLPGGGGGYQRESRPESDSRSYSRCPVHELVASGAFQRRAADAQYRQAPPIVKACQLPECLPQYFGDLELLDCDGDSGGGAAEGIRGI